MGYCPFLVLCHDRDPLALCLDRVIRVATGLLGEAHDSACVHTTDMHTRLGRAHDKVVHSRDRDCLALCRDITLVSRQGLGLGMGN